MAPPVLPRRDSRVDPPEERADRSPRPSSDRPAAEPVARDVEQSSRDLLADIAEERRKMAVTKQEGVSIPQWVLTIGTTVLVGVVTLAISMTNSRVTELQADVRALSAELGAMKSAQTKTGVQGDRMAEDLRDIKTGMGALNANVGDLMIKVSTLSAQQQQQPLRNPK